MAERDPVAQIAYTELEEALVRFLAKAGNTRESMDTFFAEMGMGFISHVRMKIPGYKDAITPRLLAEQGDRIEALRERIREATSLHKLGESV